MGRRDKVTHRACAWYNLSQLQNQSGPIREHHSWPLILVTCRSVSTHDKVFLMTCRRSPQPIPAHTWWFFSHSTPLPRLTRTSYSNTYPVLPCGRGRGSTSISHWGRYHLCTKSLWWIDSHDFLMNKVHGQRKLFRIQTSLVCHVTEPP